MDADAGELVLEGFLAKLDDFGLGGFGLEQGVIDEAGDGGIDARGGGAGRDAVSPGGEDRGALTGAGLDAALGAVRTTGSGC
jgi:hypothetical protein